MVILFNCSIHEVRKSFDKIVYSLYNLADDEVRVIEGY